METQGNVGVVRDFLNAGTSKPVATTELMQFWKSCTPEEKEQFGREARELIKQV